MRELQPSETDQWMSARCSRACRAGAATYGVKQSAQSTSVYTADSTIVSRSQRLGYKRAGPSGLAELEQLHVESNSECNRHVYLSSSLANSLLVRDLLVSTWPGCACGRGVRARQLCGYVFLV